MQNILSEMWKRYNLLFDFKVEMNKLGWVANDLYCIEMQMVILMELIEIESKNVLDNLLKTKTYFRLPKKINKGIEYLPDILENPEKYVLNPIENDIDAWVDQDNLIFTTKAKTAVFSKISRNSSGSHYLDGKFQ